MIVGDARVHQRAVAVAGHVRGEALVRIAPTRLAHLVAGATPVAKAVQLLHRSAGMLAGDEVYERVTESQTRVEVDGQVQEVVRALEPLGVEHLHCHGPREPQRQVAQHDCGETCRLFVERSALI